jgi:hypothetical protein
MLVGDFDGELVTGLTRLEKPPPPKRQPRSRPRIARRWDRARSGEEPGPCS